VNYASNKNNSVSISFINYITFVSEKFFTTALPVAGLIKEK